VLGSTNLDTNLAALITHDQHNLLRAQVSCPSSMVYPIHCTMTAFDTDRHAIVSGTATIEGVFTQTHTYVYRLLYKAGGASTAHPTGGAAVGTTGE
jgi:hypothetical protein